jgi:hypothetical protein
VTGDGLAREAAAAATARPGQRARGHGRSGRWRHSRGGCRGGGVWWGWPTSVRSKSSGWAKGRGHSVDARFEMGEGKVYPSMCERLPPAVLSLVHRHLWCHMHACGRPVRLVNRRLRLTSGPRLHFLISMIFNHPNFEIRNGNLPNDQNSLNFPRQ